MPGRVLPAPPITPESAPFFAAAREGRFLIGFCPAANRHFWYPRAVSPFTLGPAELREASGRGTIYSFSPMRRTDPPYTIAYVTLEEGPTMMTNIVDADPNALRIGMAVKLAWTPAEDGTPLPCFTPG